MFRRRLYPVVVRLGLGLWPIVQTALAASLAWVLAVLVVGYEHSSFAPVAAVLSLGVSIGQRERRAIEAIVGTAVGLALAVVLVSIIGSGPAQILLMVVVGMVVGVLFSGGPLLQNQAAIMGISVALHFGSTPPVFDTLSSMLMGCAVALVVNYFLPINPEARVNRAARLVLGELAAALEETAEALADGDLERTERALQRARGVDELVRGLREEVDVGRWTARYAPPRRRALGHLELYAAGISQIELAVLNVRGVARAALNLKERAIVPPRPLLEAIYELARSMEALGRYLEASERPEDARRFAVRAAGDATALLEERNDLATSELISMIRSAAVDILRATGMDRTAALGEVEEAASHVRERP
jgi:Fusaric acid resistance protein-like